MHHVNTAAQIWWYTFTPELTTSSSYRDSYDHDDVDLRRSDGQRREHMDEIVQQERRHSSDENQLGH